MSEPDDDHPLFRPVRWFVGLLSLGVLVSAVGAAYSLLWPVEGPSLGDLGWQRLPTRKSPPAAIDDRPRIRVQFNEQQRFGLLRLPSPDARKSETLLLTRDERGSTSNTCIRIDGSNYRFGTEVPKVARWQYVGSPLAGKDGRGSQSCMEFSKCRIHVTQSVEIVVGETTLLYDTMLVRYHIANRGNRTRTVALRAMLDVRIGDNDAPGFYIPPLYEDGRERQPARLVTDMAELSRNDIPEYIMPHQTGDLLDPNADVAVIGLADEESEPLEKLVLCRWPGNSEIGWDWDFDSMRHPKPDSCVVLYWPDVNLHPGDDRVLAFTYGLSRPTLDTTGRSPARLHAFVDPPQVAPGKTFRVVACVQTRRRDQKVTLRCPPGVMIVNAAFAEQNVPAPGPEGYARVTWWLQARHAGHHPLVVTAPGIGTVRGWAVVDE